MARQNRIGRRSAGSISRALLAGNGSDPRLRRNPQGGLTDNDVDNLTLAFNARGEMRLAAFEGIAPLDEESAVLTDVIGKINEMLRAANEQEL